MFLEVSSQELSQADAARKWGVDVSVIVRMRRSRGTRRWPRSRRRSRGGRRRPSRSSWSCAGGERSSLGGVEGDGDRADACTGEGSARAFRPGPRARERGGQARAAGADRPGGRRRVGARAGVPGARPRRRARAPLARASAGDRHARGPRSGWRCGAWSARLGGAGDPRSDRDLGVGRSLASQARASRQLHRHRVRVAVHGAPSGAQEPGRSARGAGPCTAGKARIPRGSVGAQPDLDLGRHPLHPVQAGRLRDRRRRHSVLDRLPAHQRADHDPGAAAVRPSARGPGAARQPTGCRSAAMATGRSSSRGPTTGRR